MGFSGYGNDIDTYFMISSGHGALLKGVYHYSRPPGYFVPELIIGGASLLGGYLFTNLISSLLGTASLYLFWRLLKANGSFTHRDAALIVATVGLNPHYVIAASSTTDYVYSLFFGLLGVTALRVNRYLLAAPLFALAISSRLSNTLIIGIIYLYFIYIRHKEPESRNGIRLVGSGVLAGCLTALLFLPPYIAAGETFGFFTYKIGSWTFAEYLSRFVYKNIYLFGLAPFLWLGGMLIHGVTSKKLYVSSTPEVLAGMLVLLVHELLFFKVPLEIPYLLPLLFVAMPMTVVLLRPGRAAMYTFLFLVLSYGFVVNLDILDRRYNEAGTEAIAADAGLFARPGVVVADLLERRHSARKYAGYLHVYDRRDAPADTPASHRIR